MCVAFVVHANSGFGIKVSTIRTCWIFSFWSSNMNICMLDTDIHNLDPFIGSVSKRKHLYFQYTGCMYIFSTVKLIVSTFKSEHLNREIRSVQFAQSAHFFTLKAQRHLKLTRMPKSDTFTSLQIDPNHLRNSTSTTVVPIERVSRVSSQRRRKIARSVSQTFPPLFLLDDDRPPRSSCFPR